MLSHIEDCTKKKGNQKKKEKFQRELLKLINIVTVVVSLYIKMLLFCCVVISLISTCIMLAPLGQ